MESIQIIYDYLCKHPGTKARDIATALGLDKTQVNSLLYGALRGKTRQDKAYRWWPVLVANRVEVKTEPTTEARHAQLIKYYLDCLGRDENAGLSVYAQSRFDLDYVELQQNPILKPGYLEEVLSGAQAKKLLEKVRKDKNNLTLYLGYPVRINKIKTPKWEGFTLEPILIYQFQFSPERKVDNLQLISDLPRFNFKVLQKLTHVDSGHVLDEVLSLSEELGMSDAETDFEIDEVMQRLKQIRPHWDWVENPDPNQLSFDGDRPISSLETPGIYNKAVLIVGERSPYTQGLEDELDKLKKMSDFQIGGTALDAWVENGIPDAQINEKTDLLDVVSLNDEQRQAVLSSLSKPLTIITGPPGTGKSQVVTSILINAAWKGKKVLFASKNNKAVDVVETRVNGFGSRPILLRVGANQYQTKLAEYLSTLLSATVTEQDKYDYGKLETESIELRQNYKGLESEIQNLLNLRNEADTLEQDAEEFRKKVTHDNFLKIKDIDLNAMTQFIDRFQLGLISADVKKQKPLVRLTWKAFKNKRFELVNSKFLIIKELCSLFSLPVAEEKITESNLGDWQLIAGKIKDSIQESRKTKKYLEGLSALQTAKSFEAISREIRILLEQIAENSEELWKSWLNLIPMRLTSFERTLLHEYHSILQLIMAANENEQDIGKEVFRKFYKIFPQIINIMPCWAVTSLSAKGRIPFEAGFFDLVVIDEASQCDIASALPLLYRAKNAVIIGDPKQLKHISTIPARQDQVLLAKYSLFDGFAKWAYSVNSLFDLSCSVSKPENIISLKDHHRSHPDIIGFSNQQFYEGKLRVATKFKKLKLVSSDNPAIRWVDVKGQAIRPFSGGAVNKKEAERVIEEIKHLVLKSNYRGSVGVVSPFRSQANLIRELFSQSEDLNSRLSEMDFLVDTVHKFQGDERDVMFFSPVVSKDIGQGAIRFLNSNPNLFNVAITRARSALIVVGDRQAASASGVSYLEGFSEYLEKLNNRSKPRKEFKEDYGPEYPAVSRPELVSDWEKVFYKALYSKDIKTIPQYEIDRYILDLALVKGERRLDIEVDGEKYHRSWDGELCKRDQIRNQHMIELGWDVQRFWVYEIRDDLSGCVNRVRTWIDQKT